MKCIVFVDSVDSTSELKRHGRELVAAKINRLREFVEFCFVYRLKGKFIGELGDGFLILCPPEPHRVLQESLACMSFIRAYNHDTDPESALNVRVAFHYGLISPPEGDNYLDSNISLTSRLEGVTPPNTVCVSSVVRDTVADTLRQYRFDEVKKPLKGFGQSKFYFVVNSGERAHDADGESRIDFYLKTIDAFAQAGNWESVAGTCRQALKDFKNNPAFQYQLAQAYVFLGKSREAIAAYEECVRQNYQVVHSLYSSAVCHRALGDADAAISKFELVIKRDPKHFWSMKILGEIYLDKADYDRAWSYAIKATRLNPHFYPAIALAMALAVTLKKKISFEKLATGIPDANLLRFHSEATRKLKSLRLSPRIADINRALVVAFGHNWKKRCKIALSARLETNRRRFEESERNLRFKRLRPVARRHSRQ